MADSRASDALDSYSKLSVPVSGLKTPVRELITLPGAPLTWVPNTASVPAGRGPLGMLTALVFGLESAAAALMARISLWSTISGIGLVAVFLPSYIFFIAGLTPLLLGLTVLFAMTDSVPVENFDLLLFQCFEFFL